MKEDGGKLLDEGGLEAEDVEENDVNSRRGPRRGLRGIREDARRGKGRMSRKAREVVGEGWVREEAGERSGEEAGRKGAGGGAELGLGLGLGRELARRARRGGTRRASGLDRSAGYRGVLASEASWGAAGSL